MGSLKTSEDKSDRDALKNVSIVNFDLKNASEEEKVAVFAFYIRELIERPSIAIAKTALTTSLKEEGMSVAKLAINYFEISQQVVDQAYKKGMMSLIEKRLRISEGALSEGTEKERLDIIGIGITRSIASSFKGKDVPTKEAEVIFWDNDVSSSRLAIQEGLSHAKNMMRETIKTKSVEMIRQAKDDRASRYKRGMESSLGR